MFFILPSLEIMKILGVSRGGKYLITARRELMAYQFDNSGCHAEQAKHWVMQQRARWLSDEDSSITG